MSGIKSCFKVYRMLSAEHPGTKASIPHSLVTPTHVGHFTGLNQSDSLYHLSILPGESLLDQIDTEIAAKVEICKTSLHGFLKT